MHFKTMKNSDQPAWPTFMHGMDKPFIGLTKRELFAAMAMQGLLANPKTFQVTRVATVEESIKTADALLAELDKDVVCEWKWHKDCNTYHKTGCGKHIAGLEAFLKAFPFCPYCGRKIKEVK